MRFPGMTRNARMVLAGLALSAVGGFGLVALAGAAQDSAPPAGHHAGRMPGPPMPGLLPPPGPMLDRLFDDVKATPEQREQLRKIGEAARTDLEAQHAAARTERDQMMALFTQPVVDAQAVEALRQKIQARHDATSRRLTQAMLDSSQVLTATQRQQLAERMKQHAERGGPGRAHDEPPGDRRGAVQRG